MLQKTLMKEIVMDVLAYGKLLCERGQALIKQGKYNAVVCQIFCISNNGHSGWVHELGILYKYPQNKDELLLRNAFTQLLHETLRGIKDVVYSSARTNDRPWILEGVDICLSILGESAPEEFILWQNTACVALGLDPTYYWKKPRTKSLRDYHAIYVDGHDRLTIAEHLNVLEFKLLGTLIKQGCKERIFAPDASHEQRHMIELHDCPIEIRPDMREIWELLQAVRRVKRVKLA